MNELIMQSAVTLASNFLSHSILAFLATERISNRNYLILPEEIKDKFYVHKRQPTFCTHERAMEYILLVFLRKMSKI